MSILFYFFTFINSIRYTRNTCILFQVSVCEPDLLPCSFSIFMFMKNAISFVIWKKDTPNNNPAIPPTSAIIERPVTRYVSVLEYLRAIIRYRYLGNRLVLQSGFVWNQKVSSIVKFYYRNTNKYFKLEFLRLQQAEISSSN